jgi:hypothetical protein
MKAVRMPAPERKASLQTSPFSGFTNRGLVTRERR